MSLISRSAVNQITAKHLSSFTVLHIDQIGVVVDLAIIEVLVCPFVIAILDRIFFPKRITRPVLRKKYPPEVRMTLKLYPEHVEGLTLHPVRSRPDPGNALTSLTVGDRRFYT